MSINEVLQTYIRAQEIKAQTPTWDDQTVVLYSVETNESLMAQLGRKS
jgi:hypothetical protein